MILKTGNNFEWEQTTSYQTQNLHWYATCTANTTNIHFTNPVPVTQKQ